MEQTFTNAITLTSVPLTPMEADVRVTLNVIRMIGMTGVCVELTVLNPELMLVERPKLEVVREELVRPHPPQVLLPHQRGTRMPVGTVRTILAW